MPYDWTSLAPILENWPLTFVVKDHLTSHARKRMTPWFSLLYKTLYEMSVFLYLVYKVSLLCMLVELLSFCFLFCCCCCCYCFAVGLFSAFTVLDNFATVVYWLPLSAFFFNPYEQHVDLCFHTSFHTFSSFLVTCLQWKNVAGTLSNQMIKERKTSIKDSNIWPEFSLSARSILINCWNKQHTPVLLVLCSPAFPSYISGVHHFWWDFCMCESYLVQPLR